MSFWTQYLELRKRKKAAYRDMLKKRDEISCSGIPEQDDVVPYVCLKEFPFPVIGVLDCDNRVRKIELEHCGMFSDDNYCGCQECEMFQKNHDYVDAVKAYKAVKIAKQNFVKSALKLKKH